MIFPTRRPLPTARRSYLLTLTLRPILTCRNSSIVQSSLAPSRTTAGCHFIYETSPSSITMTLPTKALLYLNPESSPCPSGLRINISSSCVSETDGIYQNNIFCEARTCYTDPATAMDGELPCTTEDLSLLGGVTGLRCAMPPLSLNVPLTPAAYCGEAMGVMMDVPGFYDPRIFWTGKGELLMMLNTRCITHVHRVYDLRHI